MSKFDHYLKEVKEKNITQAEQKKIGNYLHKTMPKLAADKWDDPDTFVTTLIKTIEEFDNGKYTVDEFSEKRVRDKFRNKRDDIYIDLDKGSMSLEFTDDKEKRGYVHISFYNDPGTKHDTRYEMSFYLN